MANNFLPVVMSLALAATLSGCDRLTQENYDKIGIGSSYDEAIEVLGKPSNCDEQARMISCRWGNDDKYVDARIIDNSIIFITSEGLE